MTEQRRGLYTLDFECRELSATISVFDVKAFNREQAERNARLMLAPSLTWTCTAIDRRTDARD